MESSRTSNYHHILLLGLQESFDGYKKSWEAFQELLPIDFVKSTESSIIEYHQRRETFKVKRTSVYLYAASFLEALINVYLSQNLAPEEFQVVEKLSPIEKWIVGPRLVDENYVLKPGKLPHQELKELFDRRNAIMHHKPFHEVNGEVWHKGKFPREDANEHLMVEKFFNLPVTMVKHLLKFNRGSEAFSFAVSSGLDMESFIANFTNNSYVEGRRAPFE